MAATTLSEINPMQRQITRIKREEDEDTWISGEELYTEGSSDDERTKGQKRSCVKKHLQHQILARRISAPAHLQRPPTASFEPVIQDEPHLTETYRRLSLMTVEEPPVQRNHPSGALPKRRCSEDNSRRDNKQEIDEQDEVMLWRPKRGTIKLPHIDLDKCPMSLRTQEKISG